MKKFEPVTTTDLDDIADLAEALEQAVKDPAVALYVMDHDEETSELLVQFSIDGKRYDSWFHPRFLESSGMSNRLLVM